MAVALVVLVVVLVEVRAAAGEIAPKRADVEVSAKTSKMLIDEIHLPDLVEKNNAVKIQDPPI